MLVTLRARAYVNWGRWVADCPAVGCNSAEQLTARQATFYCQECHGVAELEWPADADDIWEALHERPLAQNRNWFPSGHDLAIRAGQPHGQNAASLRDEHRAAESAN